MTHQARLLALLVHARLPLLCRHGAHGPHLALRLVDQSLASVLQQTVVSDVTDARQVERHSREDALSEQVHIVCLKVRHLQHEALVELGWNAGQEAHGQSGAIAGLDETLQTMWLTVKLAYRKSRTNTINILSVQH